MAICYDYFANAIVRRVCGWRSCCDVIVNSTPINRLHYCISAAIINYGLYEKIYLVMSSSVPAYSALYKWAKSLLSRVPKAKQKCQFRVEISVKNIKLLKHWY